MAKPRVFVSSTYYDLRYVRANLDDFIQNLGYEPVLFEKGDIPFQHDKLLEDSCLSEVSSCDLFVLIVGGRYGSLSTEDLEERSSDPDNFFSKVRSVTKKEYERARSRSVPMFIFVENSVLSEFRTYQKNRANNSIIYAHVDDTRIFILIDEIYQQRLNSFVRGFDKSEEIVTWLRDQWAGLFAEYLRRRDKSEEISALSLQISQLSSVANSLQSYTETIVRHSNPNEAEDLIAAERLKQAQDLAEVVTTLSPVSWFIEHDETAEYFPNETADQRNFILQNFLRSDGIIEFLDAMKVPKSSLVNSTMGIEGLIHADFDALQRALRIAGRSASLD